MHYIVISYDGEEYETAAYREGSSLAERLPKKCFSEGSS